jgi:hypothetical protein
MAKTFSFGAPETVIVSSNPASRWRILQGGQVQRSADGGATWQTQTTGVSDTLSGGWSPSPSYAGSSGPGHRAADNRPQLDAHSVSRSRSAHLDPRHGQIATVTTEDGRQLPRRTAGAPGRAKSSKVLEF